MQGKADFDDWQWWWSPWSNRIRCASCGALTDFSTSCPICGMAHSDSAPTVIVVDGVTQTLPPVFQGPLDWSPYVMLKLMYRDWQRPLLKDSDALPGRSPSPRVVVVLVFWSYFETLMDWYYERATSTLPPSVASDLLTRYGSIGVRLDRLHRILFKARYGEDLDQLGHSAVRVQLENLQKQRNAFVHGNPEAISDTLVEETVRMLPAFHEAWIASFNLRCASRR
jgi:hypothetical protein